MPYNKGNWLIKIYFLKWIKKKRKKRFDIIKHILLILFFFSFSDCSPRRCSNNFFTCFRFNNMFNNHINNHLLNAIKNLYTKKKKNLSSIYIILFSLINFVLLPLFILQEDTFKGNVLAEELTGFCLQQIIWKYGINYTKVAVCNLHVEDSCSETTLSGKII